MNGIENSTSLQGRFAGLLQVLNAFAELMTGLTCYLSCSYWTLGNRYAVVCVDSLTFLGKVYSSLQKGTSPQVLCRYSLAVFSYTSAKNYSIKHLNICLGGVPYKSTVLHEKKHQKISQEVYEAKQRNDFFSTLTYKTLCLDSVSFPSMLNPQRR